jgi:S1-C subfamily serine protease
MSGGPVVNSAGKVVGINVAVGRDEVLMTPTVGLFDAIIREE